MTHTFLKYHTCTHASICTHHFVYSSVASGQHKVQGLAYEKHTVISHGTIYIRRLTSLIRENIKPANDAILTTAAAS